MFDLGWTEMLVVAVVAILVVGPKDLPTLLRTVGQWVSKMKGMSRDLQRQFDSAMREAELDDVSKSIGTAASFNPAKIVKDEVSSLLNEDDKATDSSPDTASATVAVEATDNVAQADVAEKAKPKAASKARKPAARKSASKPKAASTAKRKPSTQSKTTSEKPKAKPRAKAAPKKASPSSVSSEES